MKIKISCAMLAAAGLMLCSGVSLALPKAAEHAGAAVMTVADVAPPKPVVAKSKQQLKAKAAPTKRQARKRAKSGRRGT